MKKKILIIILIFIILFSVFVFKNKILKIMYPKTYSEIVTTYAEQYKVDENLVYAVIKAESNFRSNAESNKSAIGLMQIVEDTAVDVAKKSNINIESQNIREELLKEDNNINVGTKYLSILLSKYG